MEVLKSLRNHQCPVILDPYADRVVHGKKTEYPGGRWFLDGGVEPGLDSHFIPIVFCPFCGAYLVPI